MTLKTMQCVNALHRASPISTFQKFSCSGCSLDVSMPYIGLLPFLRRSDPEEVNSHSCVNALHRASPISTSDVKAKEGVYIQCVNALHRASPISTVPFKKPYKINGFRDRFQGVIVRKF